MKNKILVFLSKVFKKNKKYFKDFFGKVWEIMFRPEILVLPGQLAFSVILSVVPILSIVSALGTTFGVDIQTISDFLGKIFTSVKFDLIIPSIIGQEVSIRYIIVILIMFFVASNGTNSVIIISNQIYGIRQNPYLKRRMKAILMTMMLCMLYIFILIVPLLGRKIINSFDYFNLKTFVNPVITLIRGPITWVILYYFIKYIYIIAPDKEVNGKGINLGAIFTTIFWALATYFYSAWINNFTRYDIYYGSLSSLAILMLWLYWLSYVFVIGLCLNVKVENNEMEKTGIIKNKE